MQSSYRGRGQIEGNADLINTKAYIGRNEGTLGNTINLLATLYKGYKNIPADVRWKLFGDQKALLEDQRSKDGGVIDPTTGEYYTLPFQAEAKDYSNETSGNSELDAKYPNVPAKYRAMVDDLNRRNLEYLASSGDEELDKKYPNVPARLRANVESLNDKARARQSSEMLMGEETPTTFEPSRVDYELGEPSYRNEQFNTWMDRVDTRGFEDNPESERFYTGDGASEWYASPDFLSVDAWSMTPDSQNLSLFTSRKESGKRGRF